MRVSKSVTLPYNAEQLFELINDIAAYPSFLDGCVSAEILHLEDNLMEVRLGLSKRGVTQEFVTRNRLIPNESIVMELLEGPLESLNGEWSIKPLGDQGCKLGLELDFAMKKGFIMQIMAKFFGQIGHRLFDAISEEAGRRYGVAGTEASE